jgi:BRCA1-A complex subunit BRE
MIAYFLQLKVLTSLEKQDRGGPSESRLHVQHQLLMLLEGGFISEDDVEVLVGRYDHDPVHIMVRLAVDVTDLPIPESIASRGNSPTDDSIPDVAALMVSYPAQGRCTAQLFLSPKLDEVLGGNKNLQIPSFSKRDHLRNYVTSVKELITKKINVIANSCKSRRYYLETLLNQMGRAALEFDSTNFSKVSFLLEWKNFYFIVHACLPANFPEDKPVYMFQSVYHSSNEKPYITKCQDYPYSPRWDHGEMAERAKQFILEYVDTFQKNSVHCKQNY